MRFITKKHLSRRTMLRGAGTMLALPLLDSMIPALTAQSKTAAVGKQRLGFVYTPHGAVMSSFTPASTGADWEMSTTLKPLEAHKQYINVYSNLAHHQADSLGDGGTAEQRKARMEEDRSILDRIVGQVPVLQRDLSVRDKSRMSDYLENIREIERRLQVAEKQGGFTIQVPDAPVGVPDQYQQHVQLMFDLMALAYQGDVTRVFSFMMAREVSQRSHPFIGVPEPHHSVSHHQDRPENLAKLVKIQTYYVSALASFLDKLKATPDGDGSLLDHSAILFGSCISNSNTHNHNPLPVLTAGSAGGRLKTGQHLKFAEATPMANLLVNIAHAVDISVDSIGDSTGPLAGVSA